MKFGLKINPELETRKFLEKKIETFRKTGFEKGILNFGEEMKYIFTGKYDKLKKDARFRQVFLGLKTNLRNEESNPGELFIGAFGILERVFNDRITETSNPEEQKKLQKEYYDTAVDAFEKMFTADISAFLNYFILMFLRYTYQYDLVKDDKFEQVKKKFEEFISEEKTLLQFFFYLDQFNNLNLERGNLDQDKKDSLSQRLEEEINHKTQLKSLRRQILLCHQLKSLAGKLIEVSKGHDPLDEVRRVLDQVYVSGSSENVIKGMLDKFRKYYEYELSVFQDALVFKRVIFMNSGLKVANENRKQWIDGMDFFTVEKLVDLLEIKDKKGRLSQEQEQQQKLYEKYKAKLNQNRPDPQSQSPAENCLDEGEMNLLIMRLRNVSLLEKQIEIEDQKLQNYRKENSVDYQTNIIRSYNDNIKRLTQTLYFFIELIAFKNEMFGKRGLELNQKIKEELLELEIKTAKELFGEEEIELSSIKQEDQVEAESESVTESETDEDDKEEKPSPKPDINLEKDPEKRAVLLAAELKNMQDAAKIKPLKELAYIGGMETLKDILPLSQYSSEFTRNMARNTVIKIILRLLRENEERKMLGMQQKKKLLDFIIGLDSKYAYLKEMELTNPKTTRKVLDVLIHEDKDFTARTLSEFLGDEDEKVRATAVKIMADMLNQKETSLLMKMLSDHDPRVRANAIEALEAVGDRNILGILMKYKYDKDNRARGNALKAIWKLGNKDINDSLEEMLVSTDPKMRASAVWVLGEIGHGQTNLKVLLKAVTHDKNEMVQDNLRKALTKISKREKGLSVLVADSNPEFCKNICLQLKKDGFQVSAAMDGRTALEKIVNESPDLVLIDLRMPEVNGLEVLKNVRGSEKTKELPVIVMSDLNSGILLKQITKYGASDYLLKPCSYEQINQKLQSYI